MPGLVAYCYWVVIGAASVTDKTAKHTFLGDLMTFKLNISMEDDKYNFQSYEHLCLHS